MTVAARVRQFAAWLESHADRDDTVTFAPPSGRGSPAAPAPPSTTAATAALDAVQGQRTAATERTA